jgi:hypothetical protein
MKSTIMRAIVAFIVMGTTIASIEEANAVVCARGIYRAGCAGPRGAVVAPRGAVMVPHGAVVRRPVVAPRAVIVR